jgi:nucleotide-binding universal stress UspA family protein
MIRKILVALDGSKTSESSLPYLEFLLRNQDADVTLMQVVSKGDQKGKESAQNYLQSVAASLESKGACVERVIQVGDPASQIAKQAAQEAYSLILMCSRGKTGLRRILLGSVAEKILTLSKIPVLVVHPLKDGAKVSPIRRIVVPLDGSHRSAKVLPVVAKLAQAMDAALALVIVISPTEKHPLPVDVAAQNLFRAQKGLQEQGLKVEIAIPYGDPAAETLAFANLNQANLLAIATRGRSGLEELRHGSVTKKILRNSQLPLLVLRTPTASLAKPEHLGARARRRRSVSVSR